MRAPSIASVVLAMAGGIVAQAAPVNELQDRVRAGALTPALCEAFERHALAQIRVVLGDADLAAWLATDARARERAAWVWARLPESAVFARLERLWRADEANVREYLDLALGISIAWSEGTDDVPARAFASWTKGRAAIPSIEASFGWFCAHRRELGFDIARAPWLLACFTGFIDVPLDERAWVLARYADAKPERLRDVFAEVPYIHEGLDGHAETLPNMVEHGGVCTVNTQFAMSVLRTLGFPATFAGGPGHCWPCWIEFDRDGWRFERRNELGNRDGTLGQTVLPEVSFESDLRRLASALDDDAAALRQADMAAAAARIHPGVGAAHLLLDAIDAQPLAATAWFELARQCRAGAIDAGADETAARSAWRRLPRALAGHLDLAWRCIDLLELENLDLEDLPSLRFADELAKCAADLRTAATRAERNDLEVRALCLTARLAELRAPARGWREFRALAEQAVSETSVTRLDAAIRGMERCARAGGTLPEHGRALRAWFATDAPPELLACVGDHYWRLLAVEGDEAEAARARWRSLHLAGGDPLPQMLGGDGGTAFEDHGPGDLPLVGVRWSRGEYFGIPVIASVQPLFRAPDGSLVAGHVHGKLGSSPTEMVIPSDHRLLGLSIASGNVVDGFALVSAPQTRGKSDLRDVRFSTWCGGTDRGQRLVRCDADATPRGICGRAGDLVDALGLNR